MKRYQVSFLLLLLLGLSGCTKDPPPVPNGEPPTASPIVSVAAAPDVATPKKADLVNVDVAPESPKAVTPEELRDWFGQAGDQSLLTVAVWPGAPWEGPALLLTDSLPRRNETMPIFGRIRLARDFAAAAGEVIRLMGYPEWPLSWPTLDPSRPVIFSLFAPMAPLQEPSSWLVAAYETMNGSGGVRHEILVPALAVGPLQEALIAAFSQRLKRIDQELVNAVAPPGSVLFALPAGVMAVVVAPDHVRICILENALYPGQSHEALKARLRDWLVPAPAELPLTPALQHVLSSQAPVRAYVRPSLLRGVAMQEGLAQLAMAQANAEPYSRSELRTMAAGILGTTWGFLSPASLLYQDFGVALEMEAEFDLIVVASLTAAGARAHAAAGSAVVPAVPEAAAPGFLAAGIDLAALVEALPPSPLVHLALTPSQRTERESDIVDTFRKCGPWCSIYLLLGGWPALAAVERSHARERLPRGLAAVVRSASLDAGRLRPEAAMAFSLPPDGDVKWVKQVGQWLATATGWSVTVRSQPSANGLVVAVGINLAAEDLLNLQPSQRHGGVLRLSWRTAVLSDIARALRPGLGDWLGKLGPALLEITARPNAVVIRLAQAPGDRDLLGRPLPELGAIQWQPTPDVPDDACMDQAIFAMALALEKAPHVALERREAYLAQTIDALSRAGDCAGGGGGRELDLMARTIRLLAAEMALATFQLDVATSYLEAACEPDAGALCQQLQELGKLPPLTLAQVSASCLESGVGRTLVVPWLLTDGIWRGAERLVPMVEGLLQAESLAAVVKEWSGPVVEIAIDAKVSKAVVAQLLEALKESAVESLNVLVRSSDGEPTLLTMATHPAAAWDEQGGRPVHLPWPSAQVWGSAVATGAGLSCLESGRSSALTLTLPVVPLEPVNEPAQAMTANLDNLRGPVQRLLARFGRCHREQREATPDFAIDQMLELTLDQDGTVTAATFARAVEVAPEFGRCIIELARETRFPRGDATRTFRMPVVFRAP